MKLEKIRKYVRNNYNDFYNNLTITNLNNKIEVMLPRL